MINILVLHRTQKYHKNEQQQKHNDKTPSLLFVTQLLRSNCLTTVIKIVKDAYHRAGSGPNCKGSIDAS